MCKLFEKCLRLTNVDKTAKCIAGRTDFSMTIDHAHQHFTVVSLFLFGFIQVSDSDEAWAQVSVGVLTVVDDDVPLSPTNLHLEPVSTAIIVEGSMVIEDVRNLPQALCLLFGLSYALHLDYPKAMKNTFNFIQRVMLGLGQNKLPPKLQSLKNLLLS